MGYGTYLDNRHPDARQQNQCLGEDAHQEPCKKPCPIPQHVAVSQQPHPLNKHGKRKTRDVIPDRLPPESSLIVAASSRSRLLPVPARAGCGTAAVGAEMASKCMGRWWWTATSPVVRPRPRGRAARRSQGRRVARVRVRARVDAVGDAILGSVIFWEGLLMRLLVSWGWW